MGSHRRGFEEPSEETGAASCKQGDDEATSCEHGSHGAVSCEHGAHGAASREDDGQGASSREDGGRGAASCDHGTVSFEYGGHGAVSCEHGAHGAHAHDVSGVPDRPLLAAVILNVALTVVEAAVGVWSGSLALIADALHNLGDAAALFVAYVARRIGRRGADEAFTFGYRRAELIGALINLTLLVVLGLYLGFEALERLFAPEPIQTTWVMLTGSAALVVDILTAGVLWRSARGSLNVRAALIHNLTDAATSVGVVAGALVVALTGWTFIDPLLTLVIAGGVLATSVHMLRRTAHILMEGTPLGLDLDRLRARLTDLPDVLRAHHVHAWQLDETHRAVEAHIVVDDEVVGPRLEAVRSGLRQILRSEFSVGHATLEFEWPSSTCGDRHLAGPVCYRAEARASVSEAC